MYKTASAKLCPYATPIKPIEVTIVNRFDKTMLDWWIFSYKKLFSNQLSGIKQFSALEASEGGLASCFSRATSH